MKIIFAHGKEGSINGTKATALREAFQAITPELTGHPREKQAEILYDLTKDHAGKCLLVGSSMGAAAALLCATRASPPDLLLLAPAVRLIDPPLKKLPETWIKVIHGTADDVVPHEESKIFSDLILVDDNHRLSGSLELIIQTVEDWRKRASVD